MDLDFTWDYYFMIGGREWLSLMLVIWASRSRSPVHERLAYPRPRPWGESRVVCTVLKGPPNQRLLGLMNVRWNALLICMFEACCFCDY